MKKYLLILFAALSIACSTDSTKIRPGKVEVIRPKLPCDDKLEELTKALNERIPEFQTIGVPFVERVTDGDGELVYYLEQCPTPHSDTLISNYYRMTVGYTTDMIDQYWYGFWVHTDQANIILFDFKSETRMPLEEARASQQWINDWNMRSNPTKN